MGLVIQNSKLFTDNTFVQICCYKAFDAKVWTRTFAKTETKEPRHSYCSSFLLQQSSQTDGDQTKRTLLKAAAHTGQCTPTHLHKSFLSQSLYFKVSIDLLALVSPPSFPRLKLHSLHSKSFFYPP